MNYSKYMCVNIDNYIQAFIIKMKNLTIEQFKSLKILIESVAKARRFRLFSDIEWKIIRKALLTIQLEKN